MLVYADNQAIITGAVQAAGHLHPDVKEIQYDMLSSAYKIHCSVLAKKAVKAAVTL